MHRRRVDAPTFESERDGVGSSIGLELLGNISDVRTLKLLRENGTYLYARGDSLAGLPRPVILLVRRPVNQSSDD